MQRQATAVIATLLLVSLAGCSFLAGPIAFSASKATIADSAVQDSGYQEVNVTQLTISREFSRAGITKTVKVTNWQATYEKRVDLGPLGERRAAVLSIFSTPKVEIAGQGPFNPVADYSNAELVQLVQNQYSGMSDVQQVSERQVTMLGETATVTKFSAKATLEGGAQVDVYLHVTKVSHGQDYIIAVAVHPQRIDEQANIDTLLGHVQHQTGS